MVKPGYKQTEIGVIPEDWDIGMFKNVGEFFKGSGISMRDVKPTGFPCIMYGDIYVKFDTHFNKCDFKIDENTAKRSTKAISNDLFFTASGETAEEIGKCVSYQGEEDIFIGGDIIAIRPKNEYNSLFLSFVQNSSLLIKQKSALAQGHTVVHINRDSIASLVFAYPELQEQERIAEALSDVDELISSLEKLIEKYKSIKTTCLQQMFPQNGETTPKMRLPGFTGAWEQRKLGEIGSVSMCRRIFKEQTSETGDIPFYKIGTFGAEPDAFISRELFKEYKSKYPYPKKGDILISASGSIGRTVEFAGNNEYFQDSNIVWLSHDERLSNSFLKCFYSVVKWAGIEGSTIKRLYNDNILNTVICMPSVPEQEHIGLFFENLDNLITLHQRKLDKTKKIKQGMMQQLLTGKIRPMKGYYHN